MAGADRPELLLDVLGTLVHDPFFEEVPRALGMPLEELLKAKHPTSWVEFELGDLTESEYLERFFADRRAFDRGALIRGFEEGYRFLDGVEPLLAELAARGVRPRLLSNYPIWYEKIEARLRLSRFADWSFVSCRTRRRKPDPEAYLAAARSLEVPPSGCLLVDDVEKNVVAAARLGMPSLRFTGVEALRRELERRRILA
jgi:HAD superfamily hydrolase (TIGR01509 family)